MLPAPRPPNQRPKKPAQNVPNKGNAIISKYISCYLFIHLLVKDTVICFYATKKKIAQILN
jgi:hypothetical protein